MRDIDYTSGNTPTIKSDMFTKKQSYLIALCIAKQPYTKAIYPSLLHSVICWKVLINYDIDSDKNDYKFKKMQPSRNRA